MVMISNDDQSMHVYDYSAIALNLVSCGNNRNNIFALLGTNVPFCSDKRIILRLKHPIIVL
jgi:hypothetical protein